MISHLWDCELLLQDLHEARLTSHLGAFVGGCATLILSIIDSKSTSDCLEVVWIVSAMVNWYR